MAAGASFPPKKQSQRNRKKLRQDQLWAGAQPLQDARPPPADRGVSGALGAKKGKGRGKGAKGGGAAQVKAVLTANPRAQAAAGWQAGQWGGGTPRAPMPQQQPPWAPLPGGYLRQKGFRK